MAKVIFVVQRRAGLTREQCLARRAGQQHTAIVGRLPGLTRYGRTTPAPLRPIRSATGSVNCGSPATS